jgi:cytochrome c-type biogenesis protein CcmH/NrfF
MLYAYPLALLLMAVSATAVAGSDQQTRIERLGNALLAPCCYAEPLSRHRSDVALKMKKEIADWVAQGRSDREILDHYKQLYGARVLMEPEGALRWWVYVIPLAAAGLGLLFTVALLRRWRANARQALPR